MEGTKIVLLLMSFLFLLLALNGLISAIKKEASIAYVGKFEGSSAVAVGIGQMLVGIIGSIVFIMSIF